MLKTDKRDSLKIAEQLAARRLRGVRVPSVEEEQRRLLTRNREQLMNKKRRVIVQIRMRLHYFGLFPESINRRLKLGDVDSMLVSLEGEVQRMIGMLRDEWHHLAGKIKEVDRILVEEGKNDPLAAVYRSAIIILVPPLHRYRCGKIEGEAKRQTGQILRSSRL